MDQPNTSGFYHRSSSQFSRKAVSQSPGPLFWLQIVVFGGVILYFGRSVFIPLSYALLISFVLYPACAWMERRGFRRLTAILIAVTLMILTGVLLVVLLVQQMLAFANEWPRLQGLVDGGLDTLAQYVVSEWGISRESQTRWLGWLTDASGKGVVDVLKIFLSSSAVSVAMLVLVPVYVVLILSFRKYYLGIIYRLLPGERRDSVREMILQSATAYYNFIKGMAVVYLIVGVLNSVGLLLLGIPHAILFGFIASVLTFIPYIGIVIGSLLPITMAWITTNSIWYPLGIVGVFVFVQYLEANVIFPLAVSRRLNVNTLVMLLAIFTGGILWGLSGMILFVPFVGIAKLVADRHPRWRTLSMILGDHRKKA
jgi:predicted PurR-regulated permease PerM